MLGFHALSELPISSLAEDVTIAVGSFVLSSNLWVPGSHTKVHPATLDIYATVYDAVPTVRIPISTLDLTTKLLNGIARFKLQIPDACPQHPNLNAKDIERQIELLLSGSIDPDPESGLFNTSCPIVLRGTSSETIEQKILALLSTNIDPDPASGTYNTKCPPVKHRQSASDIENKINQLLTHH